MNTLQIRSKLIALIVTSVTLVLILTGIAFDALLRDIVGREAVEKTNKGFDILYHGLKEIEQSLSLSTRHLAQTDLIVSSINLINEYQDIANYRAIIFDEEKKKIAALMLDTLLSSKGDHAAAYDREGTLLAFAALHGKEVVVGIATWRKGVERFLVSDRQMSRWQMREHIMPHFPLKTMAVRSSGSLMFQREEMSYITSDQHMSIRTAKPVLRLFPDGKSVPIGSIILETMVDDAFLTAIDEKTQMQFGMLFKEKRGIRLPVPAESLPTLENRTTLLSGSNTMPSDWIENPDYFIHAHLVTGEQGPIYFLGFLPKASLNAALNETREILLWIYLLTTLIVLPLSFYLINRSVVRPLKQLSDHAALIEGGDYRVFPESQQQDEIGLLSRVLNRMVKAVIQREKALQRARDELEDRVEQRTVELQTANTKLKELDQLKSMFIASMSHELRTPLNAIIGFSSLMLNGMIGPVTDKQKDYLKRVKNAGDHLLAMISDVIDISKIEAGRLSSSPERFRLKELFDEAMEEIGILAQKRSLKVSCEIDETMELYTDRRRLLQCLLNYLSNAVKFTETGTILLTAETEGDRVKISVRDTGIGISEADASRLFEAFERLESHLKVKAGGSGLGLYLTRKIVEELLEGEVGLQSVPGEGSSFWLRIPQELPHPEEPSKAL